MADADKAGTVSTSEAAQGIEGLADRAHEAAKQCAGSSAG
jgi:hypothetical protein